MKIRLISDLHAEFYRRYGGFNEAHILQSKGEDVLVLAGDIAVGAFEVHRTIMRFKDAGAKHIVYISGNHEYYGGAYTEIQADLEKALKSIPGVYHLYEGKHVNIDGVDFIGSTLWTNFREDPLAETMSKTFISDFKVIKGFSPNLAKHLHYTDLLGMQRKYDQLSTTTKKVFVTHFLPCVEAIHPRYRVGDDWMNKYFANDLGTWAESLENVTWLFGHTHDSMQFRVGTTEFYCNPLGYPGEEQHGKFNNTLIIEV
jgi:predicted phosphodiesterase